MIHHRTFLAPTAVLVGLLALASAPAADSSSGSEGDRIVTADGELVVRPVQHASFLLEWRGKTVYVDPVGGAQRYAQWPRPDLILIMDVHGDHFHLDTLKEVVVPSTRLVAPPAVAAQLPDDLRARTTVLTNGQTATVQDFHIEAIPAYNLTAERLKFHPRGRGNGYVIAAGPMRVYISGDTEDIPEMRSLRDITVAFVCMNLPYTMTVEQAAEAVRAFRPRIVYPYHYRGSDVERFRQLVGTDLGIEVRLRNWYPN